MRPGTRSSNTCTTSIYRWCRSCRSWRLRLAALPGRRMIFTNGSRRHAERVAEKLGVLHLFEDICDIAALRVRAKPEPEAFERLIDTARRRAAAAAMFEDMPHNLVAPHALGMTTVLVHSDYLDHPAQLKIREWRELPSHIHYLTRDLTGFIVDDILPMRP